MARSLDLNVIGVSFHVGSGCYDATAYSEAIRVSDEVFQVGTCIPCNIFMLTLFLN